MIKLDDFLEISHKRRSYRKFLKTDFNIEEIQKCIEIASTAPSGANKQPWHFIAVTSNKVKEKVYKEAIKVEKAFYQDIITTEWQKDLEKLTLDYDKPFLKEAPCLIVIFKKMYEIDESGNIVKNYYVNESVGLATGMLIAALNIAGYSSLTYTPAPMNFLKDIFNTAQGFSPYMILVVGKADKTYKLPEISKKKLEEYLEII